MAEAMDHMDLKIWRVKRGLTQAQAAKLLGCSQPSLSDWERGKYPRDLLERVKKVDLALKPPKLSKKEQAIRERYERLKNTLSAYGTTVPEWSRSFLAGESRGRADRKWAAQAVAFWEAEQAQSSENKNA